MRCKLRQEVRELIFALVGGHRAEFAVALGHRGCAVLFHGLGRETRPIANFADWDAADLGIAERKAEAVCREHLRASRRGKCAACCSNFVRWHMLN